MIKTFFTFLALSFLLEANACHFGYKNLTSSLGNLCQDTTVNNTINACGSYVIGQHTYTISGTYYDTLQTISGCDSVIITNLTIKSLPTVTLNTVSPTCIWGTQQYQCNGKVEVTATGAGPFIYHWYDYPSVTTNSINVCFSNDSVLVSDSYGCSITMQYSLIQPPPVSFTIDPYYSNLANPPVVCIGDSYIVTYTISGGTPSYTVGWNPMINVVYNTTTEVMISQNNSNGMYDSPLIDANGCGDGGPFMQIGVNPQNCNANIEQLSNKQITICPNPASNSITISINELVPNGQTTLTDAMGHILKQFKAQNSQSIIDISDLAAGMYFIKTPQGTQKFIKQ